MTPSSLADGLCLGASPAFAAMALLAGFGGPPDMLCSPVHHAQAFGSMGVMYLLMSAFHAAPWLRLISGRGRSARRPPA